jgi:hypothetical protein
MQKSGKILLALLLLAPLVAWAQSPDPIVGTWNVSASLNGSPLFIGVMTFHEGGTLTEFDTDGTNSSATESMDSGIWKNKGSGAYSFKAENYAYDTSGNLTQLAVVVCQQTLGSNQGTLKGTCTVNYYSCSLTVCPGGVQLSLSYQFVAKRF